MSPKADWKGIIACLRKPWVMTIGGLVIGALGALIFVILINYVIQPQMSVERRDIYAVRGERFNVWYHEGSSERERYTDLLARLEESLDDLVVRLNVDPSQIPTPIDVVLHDDPGQLQVNIVQRKSLQATYTFYAVIDFACAKHFDKEAFAEDPSYFEDFKLDVVGAIEEDLDYYLYIGAIQREEANVG